jgi:energy-converting hydrogenase A subunit J
MARWGVRSVISAARDPLLSVLRYWSVFALWIFVIIQYQQAYGPLLFTAFPAACAMFLVILSKMPFGPFSIVESKELVSGYKTEHFGIWRAGLEVCNGLKTYVLLAVFLMVFIGPLTLPWLLAGMIILIVLLAFSCAIHR